MGKCPYCYMFKFRLNKHIREDHDPQRPYRHRLSPYVTVFSETPKYLNPYTPSSSFDNSSGFDWSSAPDSSDSFTVTGWSADDSSSSSDFGGGDSGGGGSSGDF